MNRNEDICSLKGMTPIIQLATSTHACTAQRSIPLPPTSAKAKTVRR